MSLFIQLLGTVKALLDNISTVNSHIMQQIHGTKKA